MQSSIRAFALVALGCVTVAALSPIPVLGQRGDVPSMTNSSLDQPLTPLPDGWPFGSRDIQLRAAVCDMGYGKAGGRKFALAGDDVLPVLGSAELAGFDLSYIGVRRVPIINRGDVLVATFQANTEDPSAFVVQLKLSPEGAAKVDAHVESDPTGCVALVSGGKVLWAGGLEASNEDAVLVVGSAFSLAQAIAIADLFDRR